MYITSRKTETRNPSARDGRPTSSPPGEKQTEAGRLYRPSRELRELEREPNAAANGFSSKLTALENAYTKPTILKNSDLAANKGSTREMLDLGKGQIGMESLKQEKLTQKNNLRSQQQRLARTSEVRRLCQERQIGLSQNEQSANSSARGLDEVANLRAKTYFQTVRASRKALLLGHPVSPLGLTPERLAQTTQMQKLARRLAEFSDRALDRWSLAKERASAAKERANELRDKSRNNREALAKLQTNRLKLDKNLRTGKENIHKITLEENRPQSARTILLGSLIQNS